MAYKTLFTVLTDAALSDRIVAQALEAARTAGAHLEVLCLGVDRSQTGYYYAGANAMVLQETITRAQNEAKELEARAEALLGNSGVLYNIETSVAALADLGRHVADRARFTDLAVMPMPYGPDHGSELEPVVEAAMFEGRCPVLVVPDKGEALIQPKRVLIGWNESPEALAAVRAALPILRTADLVHVAVIDPPTHGPNRSDPGGLLSQFLSRHGVKVEVDVLSKTMPRISDILNRHATDMNADMIVMGAYGHSRFREAILGGASRYMLEQAIVPVFMAH